MLPQLVADCRADKVAAAAVKALLSQIIDLGQVHCIKVNSDLLLTYHLFTLLIPSIWITFDIFTIHCREKIVNKKPLFFQTAAEILRATTISQAVSETDLTLMDFHFPAR